MMAQLAREARIMSNLHHPGIVSVIDFAADGGSYMLVLDYVKGYNLGQWRKFVQHAGRLEHGCDILASDAPRIEHVF